MKKLLSLVCAVCLFSGMAFAQSEVDKGQAAVGTQLVYGSNIESLGLGARFMYNPINHLRAEAGFNVYFKRDHQSMFDVNLNAHYLIGVYQEKLYLYPIAGLCFASTHSDVIEDFNRFGLNLGAGAEYLVSERVGLTLEYRHTIMKTIDQGVFSIGANYKF